LEILEKRFWRRPAILAFAHVPTHELVIGEEKSMHVALKDSGELHISLCSVDFGLEKRREAEKKAPTVVEWDDDLNKQFDSLLVFAPPLTYPPPLFFWKD
jgi:hypothetical protein